jgi:hypothetical protein
LVVIEPNHDRRLKLRQQLAICLQGNVYNIAHLQDGSIGVNRPQMGRSGRGIRIFTGST